MRTIAVIALKGGSGKTTVAVHVALGAYLRGRKTLLVDIDPQRSASEVLGARTVPGPAFASAEANEVFQAQIAAVGAGIDTLVVDTAAGAVEDAGQAIVLADLALLVVRPTLLDIAAMVRTLDVVRRLGKPFLVVVNQAPVARGGVEPPGVRRALRALEFMRLPVAPMLMRTRAAYQTAVETGRSVEEIADSVAAEEFAQLWAQIEARAFTERAAPAPVSASAR